LADYKGAIVLLRVCSSQSDGKVQSFLRAYGQIVSEQYRDGSVTIDAKLGRNQLPCLKHLHPQTLQILKS
jgi:hypothetical protein